MTTTTTPTHLQNGRPEQISYPAVVLLKDPESGRRYTAVAIGPEEEPNLETDIGACCLLGIYGRPRYRVDGIERPDFDPTVPEDIAAFGWYWDGGFLVHYNEPPPKGCAIVIGMPLASLDEVWSSARKFIKAHNELAPGIAADRAKREAKAIRDAAKIARIAKKAQPTPPPAVVVVVATPAAATPGQAEQLVLF